MTSNDYRGITQTHIKDHQGTIIIHSFPRKPPQHRQNTSLHHCSTRWHLQTLKEFFRYPLIVAIQKAAGGASWLFGVNDKNSTKLHSSSDWTSSLGWEKALNGGLNTFQWCVSRCFRRAPNSKNWMCKASIQHSKIHSNAFCGDTRGLSTRQVLHGISDFHEWLKLWGCGIAIRKQKPSKLFPKAALRRNLWSHKVNVTALWDICQGCSQMLS